MELFLAIFEIIAWIVGCSIAICGGCLIVAAVWYTYVAVKEEAEEDE